MKKFTKFAKLFETERWGQVLVVAAQDENQHPALCISALPDDQGICTMFESFSNDEDGEVLRDTAFEMFTEQEADRYMEELFSTVKAVAAANDTVPMGKHDWEVIVSGTPHVSSEYRCRNCGGEFIESPKGPFLYSLPNDCPGRVLTHNEQHCRCEAIRYVINPDGTCSECGLWVNAPQEKQ